MSDSLYHNYASALFDLVEGDRYEDYLSAVRETEKNLLEQLLLDGVAPWKRWEREIPVIK